MEPSCEDDSLFPFGVSVGDSQVPPALDGSSPAIVKLDVTCPFFGTEEDILFVSNSLHYNKADGAVTGFEKSDLLMNAVKSCEVSQRMIIEPCDVIIWCKILHGGVNNSILNL